MAVNANQRIENAVLVAASDKGDAHAAVTKIRFYNEDGSPVDLPALVARVAALEGNQGEAQADAAEGAADEAPESQPVSEPQQ